MEPRHVASAEDRAFRTRFEACEILPADFDHRAHLRLAWIYLTDGDVETAHASMRAALLKFLECNGVAFSRYHETMTRAWILAVRHFMESTALAESANSFIAQNPTMLNSKIMLTHYSADLLFSDVARTQFVAPDLDPIPRHPR